MAYDKDIIFQRLGKFVKLYRALSVFWKTTLEDIEDEVITLFNTSLLDRDLLEEWIPELDSLEDYMEGSMDSSVEPVCTQFFDDFVKDRINSARSETDDIIDDLITEMNAVSDKIQENAISCGAVTATITNTYAGTMATPVVDQMVQADNAFEVICTDVTTQGEELWTVYSEELGTAPDNAVTGTEFDWEDAGITFTIAKGTTIEEEQDYSNQYSNWNVAGFTTLNTNSGKLYTKLTRETDGAYYTWYYYVRLYKDSARTAANLVAEGYYWHATGTVDFTEMNSSGISGSVDIDWTVDESSGYIILPLFLLNDKFLFVTASDEGGKFQCFMRDVYEKALPSGTGYAVTIPDSLAE